MAEEERSSRRSDQIRHRRVERVRRAVIPDSGQQARQAPRRKPARTTGRTTRRMEASIPPVMVRSTATRSVLPKRKGGKAKRRYDLAIGSTGAEMRLPSLPSLAISWRLVAFVLLGGLVFLAYEAWNSPKFRVSEVKVGGASRVTSREVNRALDVADMPVFLLKPSQMEKDLLGAFPELSAADVTISLPATVMVTVTERVPVIAWSQEGRITLVDKDGIGFPLRDGQISPPLVVEALSPPPALAIVDPVEAANAALQGQIKNGSKDQPAAGTSLNAPKPGAPFLTPEMVAGVQFLAKQAPAGTHLVYESKHGMGWKDPGGWNVYFGDAGDAPMKMSVYQAVVQRLQAEQIQPALVSVEHVDAPYYRLEP